MHSRCSSAPFLVFDFARSPTDQASDALPCGPQGVRRATRSAVSLQLRAILVWSLACLADVMHVFTAQLAFSLCGPWLRQNRPLATWSPLAITLGRRCSCSSSDSTKLLKPQPRIASLRHASSVLDGLQALASLPR